MPRAEAVELLDEMRYAGELVSKSVAGAPFDERPSSQQRARFSAPSRAICTRI